MTVVTGSTSSKRHEPANCPHDPCGVGAALSTLLTELERVLVPLSLPERTRTHGCRTRDRRSRTHPHRQARRRARQSAPRLPPGRDLSRTPRPHRHPRRLRRADRRRHGHPRRRAVHEPRAHGLADHGPPLRDRRDDRRRAVRLLPAGLAHGGQHGRGRRDRRRHLLRGGVDVAGAAGIGIEARAGQTVPRRVERGPAQPVRGGRAHRPAPGPDPRGRRRAGSRLTGTGRPRLGGGALQTRDVRRPGPHDRGGTARRAGHVAPGRQGRGAARHDGGGAGRAEADHADGGAHGRERRSPTGRRPSCGRRNG